MCMPVKMVSKMSGFYLGKARVGVLSPFSPLSLSTTPKPKHNLSTTPQTTLQQHHTNTASIAFTVISCIVPHHTTNTNSLEGLYYQATQHNNTQTIQQHYNTQKNPLQLTLQPYNANNI